jgi:hypothetical protein
MDEEITHFCGGTEDEKKMNKPKETQVATTKWFNPTALDEETKVHKCKACEAEHQPGDPLTILGGK